MRRPVWAWLALSSLGFTSVDAATRPRYGGSLTVELYSAWIPVDSATSALSVPITETLVRLNTHGGVDPALCIAWQHDADFKRWRFSLRPKVTFHDGEPLNGASAAPSLLAALKKKYSDVSIQTGGQAIVIQSGAAMPDLLSDLAAPATAIFRTSAANPSIPLIGTGPFRITSWEPGRRLAVAAFDDYWNGRPYLDAVTVGLVSQAHVDISDLPYGITLRSFPQGTALWSSAPRSLVAITAANVQPMLLQALALVIDRPSIANVLATQRGDAAFSPLPQWLTGYAFLFRTSLDIARAKQIVSQMRLGPISLSYPANDTFLRSVAERVAVNARDAGIMIQPTPTPGGNLRLIELPMSSIDPAAELASIAASLGVSVHIDSSKPETLYEAERSLLDRVIPLIHLREIYAIAPRVHIESSRSGSFTLHLEDVWVQP
jgi:peptide/nickel transport system substrate-binding protein